MWKSPWKKNYSYHICEIYLDNLAVLSQKFPKLRGHPLWMAPTDILKSDQTWAVSSTKADVFEVPISDIMKQRH